jgi:hypothetical protein
MYQTICPNPIVIDGNTSSRPPIYPLLGCALSVAGSKFKEGKGIENNSSKEGDLNDNPPESSAISMDVKTIDQVGC